MFLNKQHQQSHLICSIQQNIYWKCLESNVWLQINVMQKRKLLMNAEQIVFLCIKVCLCQFPHVQWFNYVADYQYDNPEKFSAASMILYVILMLFLQENIYQQTVLVLILFFVFIQLVIVQMISKWNIAALTRSLTRSVARSITQPINQPCSHTLI